MLDPFTIRDGIFEMDAGSGLRHGARVVDPRAGVVRVGDGDRTIAIEDLRAVAVLYVERDVRHRVGRRYEMRPKMVHCVVLVLRRPSSDVDALFAALAVHAGVPVERPAALASFSVFTAGVSLDSVSIPVLEGGGALRARRTAKAMARVAGLPMVELYGDRVVYRAADRLDLRVGEWLPQVGPVADPGPAPPGVVAERAQGALVVSWSPGPGSTRIFLALAAAGAVTGVLLLFVAAPAGIAALVVAVAMLVYAVRGRRPARSRLVVDASRIVVERDGRRDEVPIETLEMMRIADSTLVFVDQREETRVEVAGPEAASWTRSAIEHHLGRVDGGPYR